MAPGMPEPAEDPRSSGDDHDPRLLELAYSELRGLAHTYLQRERSQHTLQPTALVHEAWLRLAGHDPAAWNGKTHFLATCARAMRQVLVDQARARGRLKRGGEAMRVTLSTEVDGRPGEEPVDMVSLLDALSELQARSDRQARIVELRFFAGLTVDEVATELDLSPRTVAADWRFARAWLSHQLRSSE